MGKIVYEPKRKNEEDNVVELKNEEVNEVGTRYEALVESIDSVRPVGDTQCEFGVYLEDYVYTYLYQYASTDLGREHSGVLVGEYYGDTKETIICGMLPIPGHQLSGDTDWINEEIIEGLMEQKEKHFPGAKLLGWFHMQPGYGTMLTMKEVKLHRALFDQTGTLLLLVDPINKIETFYAYENGTLKEQTGYFLYYDKNPSMQQYMLDNPFSAMEKEETDDEAVHQFREIGKIRKKEYQQRKRTNFTVVAASIAILAVGAVVIKMSDQNKLIMSMQSQLKEQAVQAHSEQVGTNGEEEIQFIINTPQEGEESAEAEVSLEEQINQNTEASGENGVKIVDNTKVNLTPNQEPEVSEAETTPAQDEVKEEVKETVTSESQPEENKVEENKVEESKVEEEEEVAAVENYMSYTVQEGDTLRKISQDHYQTEKRAREIIQLNDLDDGDQIYVGQKLKLPEK